MAVVIEQCLFEFTIGQHAGQAQEHRLGTGQIRQPLRVLCGEVLQCRWSEIADHLDDVVNVRLTQRLQVAYRFGKGATPGSEADDAGVQRSALQVQCEQLAEFPNEFRFLSDLPEIVDVHLCEVVGIRQFLRED